MVQDHSLGYNSRVQDHSWDDLSRVQDHSWNDLSRVQDHSWDDLSREQDHSSDDLNRVQDLFVVQDSSDNISIGQNPSIRALLTSTVETPSHDELF